MTVNTNVETIKSFVGGSRVESGSSKTESVLNPATKMLTARW
jgi:hypothetical protein